MRARISQARLAPELGEICCFCANTEELPSAQTAGVALMCCGAQKWRAWRGESGRPVRLGEPRAEGRRGRRRAERPPASRAVVLVSRADRSGPAGRRRAEGRTPCGRTGAGKDNGVG